MERVTHIGPEIVVNSAPRGEDGAATFETVVFFRSVVVARLPAVKTDAMCQLVHRNACRVLRRQNCIHRYEEYSRKLRRRLSPAQRRRTLHRFHKARRGLMRQMRSVNSKLGKSGRIRGGIQAETGIDC